MLIIQRAEFLILDRWGEKQAHVKWFGPLRTDKSPTCVDVVLMLSRGSCPTFSDWAISDPPDVPADVGDGWIDSYGPVCVEGYLVGTVFSTRMIACVGWYFLRLRYKSNKDFTNQLHPQIHPTSLHLLYDVLRTSSTFSYATTLETCAGRFEPHRGSTSRRRTPIGVPSLVHCRHRRFPDGGTRRSSA